MIIALRVQPGAKRSRLMGMHGDRLRVAVAAPPVDGKANKALIRWFAKELGLRPAHLELVSGQTGRDKRVRVAAARSQIVAAISVSLDP